MGHDIVISRPSEADAGRIAEIHISAMGSNPLLHAQFPTPEGLQALRRFLEAETLNEIRDAVSGVLVSRDGPDGPVTGFVKWTSPSHPQDAKLERGDIVHLEGCCRRFLDEYASLAEQAKERSVPDEPPCYRKCARTSLSRAGVAWRRGCILDRYAKSGEVAMPSSISGSENARGEPCLRPFS